MAARATCHEAERVAGDDAEGTALRVEMRAQDRQTLVSFRDVLLRWMKEPSATRFGQEAGGPLLISLEELEAQTVKFLLRVSWAPHDADPMQPPNVSALSGAESLAVPLPSGAAPAIALPLPTDHADSALPIEIAESASSVAGRLTETAGTRRQLVFFEGLSTDEGHGILAPGWQSQQSDADLIAHAERFRRAIPPAWLRTMHAIQRRSAQAGELTLRAVEGIRGFTRAVTRTLLGGIVGGTSAAFDRTIVLRIPAGDRWRQVSETLRRPAHPDAVPAQTMMRTGFAALAAALLVALTVLVVELRNGSRSTSESAATAVPPPRVASKALPAETLPSPAESAGTPAANSRVEERGSARKAAVNRAALVAAPVEPVVVSSVAQVPLGTLVVVSQPEGAEVFLNGILQGTTPLTMEGLRSGTHVLRLDYPGFDRWSWAVRVVANQRNRIAVSLQPQPQPRPPSVS
jgi:PEGA domain